ncbi:MAG: ABC transporter permease [Nitrososphaeria archaeon]
MKQNVNRFMCGINSFKNLLLSLWTLFKTKKSALISLAFLTVIVTMSVFPQFFTRYDAYQIVGDAWTPPSFSNPLGTDDVGRDVWSQIVYGAKVSLIIGLLSALLATVIGSIVGILSAYYGGLLDQLFSRIVEFFMSIPNFPLMVVLAYILKPSLGTVILAIAIGIWTQPAKVIRSEVLSLKERPYIIKAKLIGCSSIRILYRYILPRVMPIITAMAIIAIGWAIPSEAFLSWLGLGDITQVSWGIMLYFAFGRGSVAAGAWWHFTSPGILIVLVNIAFMNVGQVIKEMLNPRYRA